MVSKFDRSPYFFLWGFLKGRVCANEPRAIPQLRDNIRVGTRAVQLQINWRNGRRRRKSSPLWSGKWSSGRCSISHIVSINPQDFCFILKQKGIKNIMDKKNINHLAPANHSVLYKTLKNFTNAVPCHCYRDCICKICNWSENVYGNYMISIGSKDHRSKSERRVCNFRLNQVIATR